MMPEEDYDLAGFTVGIVDKKKIVDGSRLQAGDVLLGVKSSGVHSNGFSLVRKVFGIGVEAYTVGSSEFYLAYAAQHPASTTCWTTATTTPRRWSATRSPRCCPSSTCCPCT